jgi:hypothetical protein
MKTAARASAALAQQIAQKLKSPSPSSCTVESARMAQVIRLKS